MRISLKHIMVLLAGTMLIMHSLIPHAHITVSHSDEKLFEESSGILGLIAFIFHEDLGEDHLEHIMDTSADIQLDIQLESFDLVILSTTGQLLEIDQRVDQTQNGFRYFDHTRGPPVLA